VTYDCERNDMFFATAKEFLDVVAGESPQTCVIGDGLRVLEIVEAARRASSEGRAVTLEPTA